MIICVAPNTAVDRTLVVPGLRVGHIFRAQETLNAAGGKGVNVARAGRLLGAETLCVGFLGGSNRRVAETFASQEGLQAAWTWIAGETRSCHIMVDPTTGQATVVNESGPAVTSEEWELFQTTLINRVSTDDYACFSGSLPPGVQLEAFTALIEALCGKTERDLWIDTSGAPLRSAIEIGTGRLRDQINIKVNSDEIAAVLGKQIATPDAALEAALDLQSRGIRTVILTLGKSGAVMAGPMGAWRAESSAVQVVSAVGSGDTFLAGLVTALAKGASPPDSLCAAVASGTANTLTVGGGSFSMRDYASLLEEIKPDVVNTARGRG